MFFMIAGIFFVIISMVILIVGLIGMKKKTIKIGLWSLSLPAICFGIIFFFYGVLVPMSNKSQMKDYSGTYLSEDGKYTLTLKNDGTYISDSIPELRIHKNGIWKTGGIDGMLELYDNKGALKTHISHGVYPDGTLVLTFVFEEIKFLRNN